MMKKILPLTILLFVMNFTYSQTVTNLETKQIGDYIELSYDLDKVAGIEVFISENGGFTFKKITKIAGDVGDPVAPGRKKIVWSVLEEYDNFVGENVVFKVIANPSLKATQTGKKAKPPANQNLNGHYISLGSSVLSSGYYGMFGLSYEYRHHILGVNAAVGYGYSNFNIYNFAQKGHFNACLGLKLYFSNVATFAKNLYVNFLPFCYFGQTAKSSYISENESIIEVIKYPHLYGVGFFVGYCPVWYVNKKVALGFNVDIGMKTDYRFKTWATPINGDLGFVIKF